MQNPRLAPPLCPLIPLLVWPLKGKVAGPFMDFGIQDFKTPQGLHATNRTPD